MDCIEEDNTKQNKEGRVDTLRLTQEFNEKFFLETSKRIEITTLSIILDDIKNYRSLTDEQMKDIEQMNIEDKVKVIRTFNIMFAGLEDVFCK